MTPRPDAALMFVSSCHRFLSLAVVLVSGCFAELSTGDEPDTTSSSQSCSPGSIACACYGNGTCDAGLECVAEISACIPSGCMPGTLQCTCEGSLCAQGLECEAGLCVEPDSGSSSTSEPDPDGSTSTSDATSMTETVTTTASTTVDPVTSTTDPSSSSTTSDPTTDSESETESESESGDPMCELMSCGQCFQCVGMPGGECAEEAAACEAIQGCEGAAICFTSCGVKGLCLDDCCEDRSPEAVNAAVAFNACRENACVNTCVDYNDALCNG